jgi:hypothetical protein
MRYLSAGPMPALMDSRAAEQNGLALQNIGNALETMSAQGFQLAQRAREADEAGKIAAFQANLDQQAGEFSNSLMTRQDPQNWPSDWQKMVGKAQVEAKKIGLSPAAQQKFELQLTEWGTSRGIRFSGLAASRQLEEGRSRMNGSLEYYTARGDHEGTAATMQQMRGSGMYSPAEMEKAERISGRGLALAGATQDIQSDPGGFLKAAESESFLRAQPNLTLDDQRNLISQAKQAQRQGQIATFDEFQDLAASNPQMTAEDARERFKDRVPPRVMERMEVELAQRHDEQEKLRRQTPEYREITAGKVSGLLAGFRSGSAESPEQYAEAAFLVDSLPDSPIKRRLKEEMTAAKEGRQAEIRTRADAGMQSLKDAYEAGRFGPTEFKAMKVSEAIQGGFLRDKGKLAAIGFNDDQQAAILAEKSDEKRRLKFQELWQERGNAASNVDPLVWRTAEAIRTGGDTAQFLSGDDQAKLDSTYRNYGRARVEFSNWMQANPDADESKVSEKIKELGGKADSLQFRQLRYQARPGTAIDGSPGVLPPKETSMNIPKGTRITSYGYPGDTTPDSNSKVGIGAWVSDAEAERIKAGENTPNRLREGDIAVSPDVERQLVAAGIQPKQEITVRFADGSTHTGRWMDRTSPSLRGRVDLYSPGGPSSLNDTPVVGIVL